MDNIVQVFKAMGDETRLKILTILSIKRICAKGIAKHLDISEAAVSQHIKVLKDAGLILGEKAGYHVHYHIQEPAFSEIILFIEQFNSEHRTDIARWNIHMPNDCQAECKANPNKCCHRKIYK